MSAPRSYRLSTGLVVATLLAPVGCRRDPPSGGTAPSAPSVASPPARGLAEQRTTLALPPSSLRLPEGFREISGASPPRFAPASLDVDGAVSFGPELSVEIHTHKGSTSAAERKRLTESRSRVFSESVVGDRAVVLGGRVARLHTVSWTTDRTARRALRLLVPDGDDLDVVTAAALASAWPKNEKTLTDSILSFELRSDANDRLDPTPHVEAKRVSLSLRFPKEWKVDPSPPEGTVFAFAAPTGDREGKLTRPAMLGVMAVSAKGMSLDDCVTDGLRNLAEAGTDVVREDDARVTVDAREVHLSWQAFSLGDTRFRQLQAFVLVNATLYIVSGLAYASAWSRHDEALTAAILSFRVRLSRRVVKGPTAKTPRPPRTLPFSWRSWRLGGSLFSELHSLSRSRRPIPGRKRPTLEA